jgi:hypothetical protein
MHLYYYSYTMLYVGLYITKEYFLKIEKQHVVKMIISE